MLHIKTLIDTQHIICLKKYVKGYDIPWKHILSFFLKYYGGKFLLHCNFSPADGSTRPSSQNNMVQLYQWFSLLLFYNYREVQSIIVTRFWFIYKTVSRALRETFSARFSFHQVEVNCQEICIVGQPFK